MLHLNMPFSLPVIVGRIYLGCDADQTTDVWIGSEIEPRLVGRKTAANGQIIEYWLIVQDDIEKIVIYRIGMPGGLEEGDGYEVGYKIVEIRPPSGNAHRMNQFVHYQPSFPDTLMITFVRLDQAAPIIDRKFCLQLGQLHWFLYCLTPSGRSRMMFMPNYDYFFRANILFLGGFSSGFYDGLHAVVNTGNFEERKNDAWRLFLDECVGDVLLDSTFPDVRPSELAEAKRFFGIGYGIAMAVTRAVTIIR